MQSYGGEDCEVEMQGSIRGYTGYGDNLTLCLLGDHSRFNDGLMLRAAYINMKGIIKQSLKTAVASLNESPTAAALPFIRTLPAIPASMDRRIMEQAYGTEERPAPSLPEGITMHDLIQLKSTIPVRGSRTSLQLQLPKQAFCDAAHDDGAEPYDEHDCCWHASHGRQYDGGKSSS